jgi:putative DNA primase/helicase
MDFRSFLHSIGLEPRSIEPGKWQRCPTANHPKKKNGSFKLADDGLVGWAMDYALHSELVTWRPDAQFDAPKIDYAEIARRRREQAVAAQAATYAARAHYRAAELLHGSHPYLRGKGLNLAGCGGLRVDSEGWLVIPMMLGGKISSIQRISPDGDKRFWPGAPVAGATYLIGDSDVFAVVCEGFATGLTLFQAMPHARVIVAFNAGNLLHAVDYLDRNGLAVIAADNDHETAKRVGFNPGIEKATEAAQKVGIGIAYPTCSGSDWDDYRQERTAALADVEQARWRASCQRVDLKINHEIAMAVKREAKRPSM